MSRRHPIERVRTLSAQVREVGTAESIARARALYQAHGAGALTRKALSLSAARTGRRAHPVLQEPPGTPSAALFPGAVMVLTDITIPQCFHYRVEQKLHAANLLGLPFFYTHIDEKDNRPRNLLQLASVLVVYRLQWSPTLESLIQEARRLGVRVVYETDDAVHNREFLLANGNVATLSPLVRQGLLRGSRRYLQALRLCDDVLASTEPLADDLGRHVAGRRLVVNNAIDADMRAAAASIAEERAEGRLRDDDDAIVITYGSGSLAHDVDFAQAADGLARVMHERPRVRLRLLGYLRVPAALAPFADRVERVTFLPYQAYLREIARSDITVAPLEPGLFNDCKSQVKYLEAGLLGIPFVASPTTYARYVDDGRTGLLAATPGEWAEAVLGLVDDADLRRSIGNAGHEHVDRWSLENVARTEYATLAGDGDPS